MAGNIGIARFWYEGNSFSPLKTDLTAFEREEWVSGEETVPRYRGIATEMGGAIAFRDHYPEWKLHFLHCCSAPPGGPLTDDAFEKILSIIKSQIKNNRWDAFYLSLHGAAVTETDPLPEWRLLKAVRESLGATPLGVTFDFHANLSAEMLSLCDIAIGYKTYPHTDMAETAYQLLKLLTEQYSGQKYFRAFTKLPIILPSFNMRTNEGPMAELRQIAEGMDCLDISLFGGFAYADSPAFGPTILTLAETKEAADRAADFLANEWKKRIPQFFVNFPDPQDALAQLPPDGRPIVLLDPADNPLSGGIGDTTVLLRAMLDHPQCGPALFAFFYDPELAARCHDAGEGNIISANLGGRFGAQFGAPVPIEARILKNTDGRFINQGPMWHGATANLGKTSLLEIGHIQVIVTETCQAPNDPAYFSLHGLDIMRFKTIGVKAKNHFRAAFKNNIAKIIEIDCPGPAALNIKNFPFKYAGQRSINYP